MAVSFLLFMIVKKKIVKYCSGFGVKNEPTRQCCELLVTTFKCSDVNVKQV